MTRWRPELSPSDPAPLYRQLAEAIAEDIGSGKLAAGERLPPQRELAHSLSISVGAVTRAYDVAVRRGLLTAHVGRGTFVIDRSQRDELRGGTVDLSVNIAPVDASDAMAGTISALRRSSSWPTRLNYQPPFGLEADRRAGAAWLARSAGLESLDWQSLICCAGAQNAMAIAFSSLIRRGDTILCEMQTFPGLKLLAEQQGYRLHGVAMDEEGVVPQALDQAVTESSARVFYTLPTLHNPTSRTMGPARRAEIAGIARTRGLWIVEDDIYAPYAQPPGNPPLATLAPEQTFYVSSLSKVLSPGLRCGFLVAPSREAFDRCVLAVRALMHSPSGIGSAVATEWMESGRADDIAREVRAEARARAAMVLAALEGFVETPSGGTALHLWIPMRRPKAENMAARILTAGVRLTPPSAFSASDNNVASGLRLCAGSAPNRATLAHALSIVKAVLRGETDKSAWDSL